MVKLTKEILRVVLRRINTDPKTREIYNSKLDHMINFLRKTSGFKIAAVKEGGSRGKQTDTRKSDVDIIYTISKDREKNKVKNDLLTRAKKNFKKGVYVHAGDTAVHIDYNNPRCNIDLVYKNNKEFKEEAKEINQIRKMRPMHKNAIKLVKYALDKAKIDDVHGYEVELACIQLNDNNLVDCVTSLVKFFTGRITTKGKTVDQVLQRLS